MCLAHFVRYQLPFSHASAVAPLEQLERVAELLQRLLRLLPAFKRKTLQAQWFWLLPPGEASEQASAGPDTQGAALEQGQHPQPTAAKEQQQQQQQQQEQQQQQDQQQAEQGQQADREHLSLELELGAVQEAAGARVNFIAAPQFLGAVAGYCFKLGEEGVGYYVDCPPKAAPLLTPDSVRSTE